MPYCYLGWTIIAYQLTHSYIIMSNVQVNECYYFIGLGTDHPLLTYANKL